MFHHRFLWFRIGLVAGLVVAGAIVTTPAWSGPNEDHQMIKERIHSALAADPMVAHQPIGVSIFGERVVLQGVLSDQKTIDRAVEIVKQVDGVGSIQNDLVVATEGGPSTLPEFRDFQSP